MLQKPETGDIGLNSTPDSSASFSWRVPECGMEVMAPISEACVRGLRADEKEESLKSIWNNDENDLLL